MTGGAPTMSHVNASNTLQHCADKLDASSNAAAGRVHRQVTAIPGMIVPSDHSLRIGKDEAGHFGRPGFDPATMLIQGFTESPTISSPRRGLSSATA